MACRRSCGCLSAADLGVPGGAASLDDNGQVVQRGYIPTALFRRDAGDLTITSTVWADVPDVDPLVLPAVVGDHIEVCTNTCWFGDTVYGCLDVVTAVNALSSGAPSDDNDFGVSAWLGPGGVVVEPVGGSVPYIVQAADVVAGSVTLTLVARINSAGSKVLRAQPLLPLFFSAVNFGQA